MRLTVTDIERSRAFYDAVLGVAGGLGSPSRRRRGIPANSSPSSPAG
ncbi:VOC family protein [Streptomyces griseus]